MYGTITRYSPSKKTMTAAEFVKAYKEGIREFNDVCIEPETVFYGKLVQGTATYPGYERHISIDALNQIRFRGCHLEKLVFAELDLSKTIFEDCYLGDTLFECCNLDYASFQGIDLSQTYFAGIVGAKGTLFDESSNISNATFARCIPLGYLFKAQYNSAMARRFKKYRPFLYWLWKIFTDCGRKYWLLLVWSCFLILLFATIFFMYPASFTFIRSEQPFSYCILQSIGIFVSLENAVQCGCDTLGKVVLLAEMVLSYLMLGLLASFFATVFPKNKD